MEFAGLIKQSLLDYPDRIAAVVFTYGCNLRCPFCHNGHLLIKPSRREKKFIPQEEVLSFLEERQDFLEALVISGGEPTMASDLPDFIKKVKDYGFLVKLDTNGTNPDMLKMLIEENLVDYIAMDIKAPLELDFYARAAGNMSPELFMKVRSSIKLLLDARVQVEFRTTVVPGLLAQDDIVRIAQYIRGAERYTLQQFNPENALTQACRSLSPYTREELESIREKCLRYVKDVRIANI